jgi:predicted esterase
MSRDRPIEPVTTGRLSGLVRRGGMPDSPTAVLLHGYGGDEKVMWIFSEALPPAWTIIAFRGISPAEEGGFRWHVGRRWPPPEAEAFGPAVDALRQSIPTGQLPVWIGFSQGAALALCCAAAGLASTGVACLAGYMPRGLPPLAAGLPVFWAHGRRDDKVPIDAAQASGRQLEQWGVQLDFCEADSGHKIGAECLRALAGWIRRLA